MQYGPMLTSGASFAPDATMEVGWIRGIPRPLLVQDHRGEDGFGHQGVADLGPALELPDIAAMALFDDMHVETVSGKYRTAKARILDAHEINQLAFRFPAQRMHDQHGRHHRARRKMALEIMFVDRDVLDAGGALIRHHVDHLIDHQKRMAMRDHLHDPLDADRRERLPPAGCIGHGLSFFCARRCSTAICLMNVVSGTAGLPQTVIPAGMSRMTPLFAAIRAPPPMCRWPARPPCPPIMTKSSSLVLPAMPTCPARTQPRPIRTLCPICTRLSIIVPEPITVSGPEPRS